MAFRMRGQAALDFLMTYGWAMLIVAVVLSMRIVGILLVSSFIVIPASTALLFCRGFRQAIAFAAAIGVASVVAGLVLAYYLDLAAGGAVVMVLIAVFFAVLVYKQFRPK